MYEKITVYFKEEIQKDICLELFKSINYKTNKRNANILFHALQLYNQSIDRPEALPEQQHKVSISKGDLTDRQTEIFEFICNFIFDEKKPPTYRDIADGFGVGVKGAVDHVEALRKKGWISIQKNKARSIKII